MQAVPTSMRNEMADQGIPHQRHVADDIQDLVPYELVIETKTVVQHAGVPDDDGIFQRAAEREPLLPHHLDFLEEAEGPRRCNLIDE